jgi:methylmalonyl-CoA mutase cobalamin-binding subunit
MSNEEEKRYISIGALARTCGTPVETLRNWERRYGFPAPVRLASGHRRYPLEYVPRLRLVRRVLEAGFKPSFAVAARVEDLEHALREATGAWEGGPPAGDDGVDRSRDDLVRAAIALDAPTLDGLLRRAWSRFGAQVFVTRLAVGFLREIGDRWADGSLHVAHEHFASEVLQSFLAGQWRPMAARTGGRAVVLAAPEGELHVLGLHMAAVFLAMAGLRPVFLGANTPLRDIIVAARDGEVVAVVIALSAASDPAEASRRLAALRQELPGAQVVAFGGNPDLPEVPGTRFIPTLEAFAEWVPNLA